MQHSNPPKLPETVTGTPSKYLEIDMIIEKPLKNLTLKLIHGDITKIPTDCIVNAANNRCLGGGGVDGAIHRAAGHHLYEECLTLNGCETGQAKMTDAYDIKSAKKIIHTVGPMVKKKTVTEKEENLLKSCYVNSMNLANSYGFSSISFPCISTGVYGYDAKKACELVVRTMVEYDKYLDKAEVKEAGNMLSEVIFVCFLGSDVEFYCEQLKQL